MGLGGVTQHWAWELTNVCFLLLEHCPWVFHPPLRGGREQGQCSHLLLHLLHPGRPARGGAGQLPYQKGGPRTTGECGWTAVWHGICQTTMEVATKKSVKKNEEVFRYIWMCKHKFVPTKCEVRQMVRDKRSQGSPSSLTWCMDETSSSCWVPPLWWSCRNI